ncbi:C-terminal binding protein [Oceanobacillus jeddahense]|uniref:C-terminal binding protein n=1 Tax=Oceanobacillus jeddahense TaxID=1462527 RepID=A0ABY5JVT0_9BACI|nr:C-terminal binding protein [Oceanobacillus jeddahense]UUI02962.1 C-terminal binding protein [Oceanobacillus jeddahense]
MKVVVTDVTFKNYDIERALFEEMGVEFVVADCKTTEDLVKVAKDADALLNAAFQLTKERLALLPNLKVICRYGIGFDTIDVNAATEQGVYVANVQDYCHDEVADHALTLILASARKIIPLHQGLKQNVHSTVFDQAPIRRIRTQTVGLVSFGNIARNLSGKLKAIGYSVIAFDPYCSVEVAEEFGVELVSLEELMKKSDIISVHAPLNNATHHLINEAMLTMAKEEAIIINTGRGPVIDEKALIKALQDKTIAGAALDVFETEPLSKDNPLLEMDNVIVTPHAAFYSDESAAEMKTKAAENIKQVLVGGVPRYLVNTDIL